MVPTASITVCHMNDETQVGTDHAGFGLREPLVRKLPGTICGVQGQVVCWAACSVISASRRVSYTCGWMASASQVLHHCCHSSAYARRTARRLEAVYVWERK